MNTTAKQIREKYDKLLKAELSKLQKKCPHIKSTWCEECWAPAHFTGRRLKICDVCEKVLDETKPNWQPILSATEFTK